MEQRSEAPRDEVIRRYEFAAWAVAMRSVGSRELAAQVVEETLRRLEAERVEHGIPDDARAFALTRYLSFEVRRADDSRTVMRTNQPPAEGPDGVETAWQVWQRARGQRVTVGTVHRLPRIAPTPRPRTVRSVVGAALRRLIPRRRAAA